MGFNVNVIAAVCFFAFLFPSTIYSQSSSPSHSFNAVYKNSNIDRIAFPIGGMGAGMFCLEGTGAISHMSVRHNPDIFNEPLIFGAISLKGHPGSARVLEGPVPGWKKYGMVDAAKGHPYSSWGLARFTSAEFLGRFPFAEIALKDEELPLQVTCTGWSPFIPTDPDNSSLPVGAIEYRFKNTGKKAQDYVFSYSAQNFMTIADMYGRPLAASRIKAMSHGFILSQEGTESSREFKGDFAIFAESPGDSVFVDHCWFRGAWYDPLSRAWDNIENCRVQAVAPIDDMALGASLYVPFTLQPSQEKTIRLLMAWYVPNSKLRVGEESTSDEDKTVPDKSLMLPSPFYKPWYSKKFKSVDELARYWKEEYTDLKKKSTLFRNAFYKSTLPPEVLEGVAANLSILKSPTVLRQYDGRLWAWEGSNDDAGSCPGSCTHVWNYAQALSHLFPSLERGLRETEFQEDQNKKGHQTFRAALPIRPLPHTFYAAADGQLGGIMKVYREWRIAGDSTWIRMLYPKITQSLDYCIDTWDPRHIGAVEEPHHNTYDIEFWGADPMCNSMYVGALEAAIKIGTYLGEDISRYRELYKKGRAFMENELYNGSYFCQKTKWTGLNAADPVKNYNDMVRGYSEEGLQLMQKEGPKYQLGKGCLSDGVLGAWLAQACGLEAPLDTHMISRHLSSIYNFNFKKSLKNFSNPQRATFALGNEGGLILCSWPNGGRPSLPFVYSNEVWTGIEYQTASHMIFMGKVKEGLDIVRACRKRYDGSVRNPFDEYECGHWYARAMSSYALIESLTGVRYDAVDKTLYVRSQVGDFVSFLSTNTGFGNVIFKNNKASLQVAYGTVPVEKVVILK